MRWLSLFLLVIPSFAATIDVTTSMTGTQVYTAIEGATCGDTVLIHPGTYTYSDGSGPLARIQLTSKKCGAANPLTITAYDQNNIPVFDYSGNPLDYFRGTVNVSGTAVTWVSGEKFISAKFTGKTITIAGLTGCTVASVGSLTSLTVSGCSGTVTGANYSLTPSTLCDIVPGSYSQSDCLRGAWQIVDSSYITISYIKIKGATSGGNAGTAGIRYSFLTGNPRYMNDHLTFSHLIIDSNWNGLQGSATNTVIEYSQFINNGFPGDEQEHQIYDSDGDFTTIRYNYFDASGCCINADGTYDLGGSGGQNIHERAWHSYIYGNWFGFTKQYQWDMMTPDPTIGTTTLCQSTASVCQVPADNTMRNEFYGNVVIATSCASGCSPNSSKGKLFTFDGDPIPTLGFSGAMDSIWAWNTIYMKGDGSQSLSIIGATNPSPPNASGAVRAIFEFYNTTSSSGSTSYIDGGIALHFSNNIVHMDALNTGTPTLLWAKTTVSPSTYSIDGGNNYFDTNITNQCVTPQTWASSSGTCYLTNNNNGAQASPPFANLAGSNFAPNAAGAFGTADTTKTQKPLKVQTAPMVFATPSSWNDIGAIQAPNQPASLPFLLF